MKRQNKDPASGAQLCEKRPGFSVTGRLSFMTASPSWSATFFSPLGLCVCPEALSGATRMRTLGTKPLVRSCDPAPPGLLWRPGPWGPLFCPPGSVFPPHREAQPLCSALRPLPHPPTHPFAGHKGPFLFAEPKEARCQGDRSGNSRELAMGGGALPPNSCQWEQSQLGLQHLPAGEGMAPREHIPFALPQPQLPPITSRHWLLSLGATSQPAQKMLQ